MRGDRAIFSAFVNGEALADVASDLGWPRSYTEERLRAYLRLLNETPRTHYRRRGWCHGSGKITQDPDRVTCRRCLQHVDEIGAALVER